MLRHALWLMPLTLSIILMAWCYYHPLDDTYGRQSLALMLTAFAGMGFMLMILDKKGLV